MHDTLLEGKMRPSLRRRVIETLKVGAHGNFSWIRSSLELLAGLQMTADFEKQLRNLPSALDGMYDMWYRKARHSSNEAPTANDAAICWLLHAQRPLTRRELLAAVGLTCNRDLIMEELNITGVSACDIWQDRPERGTLAEAEIIDKTFTALLESCQGFIVWDGGKKVCRFSHDSAGAYLAAKPEYASIVAQGYILKACLEVYIANTEWKLPYCEDLEQYACLWWPKHYIHLDEKLSPVLTQQIQDFHTCEQTTRGKASSHLSALGRNRSANLSFDMEGT